MAQSIFTFDPGSFSFGGITYTGFESAAEFYVENDLGSIVSGDPNNIAGGYELYDCISQRNNSPPEDPILVFILAGDTAPPTQNAFTTLATESDFGLLTFQSADAVFGIDGNVGIWQWSTSAASSIANIYSLEGPAPYEVTITYPDPPPPPPACDEIGRATRAYVSAYDRSRVHQARLYRFERRCLVANFNGAIPPARTIVSATWRTDAPEIGVISGPQINSTRRETMVMFASQLGGWANIRVDATLDNGEIYTQVYRVNVREASWFFDDPPSVVGPYSVMVTV